MSDNFDNWYKNNDKYFFEYVNDENHCENICKKAWDHQQAEIDKIEAQLEEAERVIKSYAAIACPLPKQLDDNEEIKEMADLRNAPYFMGGKKARQYFKNKKDRTS